MTPLPYSGVISHNQWTLRYEILRLRFALLHGIQVIETKRDRVRFKYGKQLKLQAGCADGDAKRRTELRFLILITPTGDKAFDAEVGGDIVEVVMGILALETGAPLQIRGLEGVVQRLKARPQCGGFRC